MNNSRHINHNASFPNPVESSLVADEGKDSVIRRTVLPGGLRVVTEAMPGARSAAFGIWVNVGSRDEGPAEAGASHFLEHVLFKGTDTRTALEISASIDAVGGELNAFTSKEHTCYYAHVLAEDLPLAVDLVCDVVTRATIAAADVDSERGVILEEIAMRDDDPSDAIHDLFSELVFVDHPLGRPILGTVESIQQMPADDIARYFHEQYRLPVMVASAAGQVDHDAVVEMVSKSFGELLEGDVLPQAAVDGDVELLSPAQRLHTFARSTEQTHLVLGGLGLSRHDDRRFTLSVLNNALGGGSSSRLFQEIREKRGLAYATYSYYSSHAETGLTAIYTGCQPNKAREVLEIIQRELADLASHGFTDDEVARGKGQARGGLVLGMEDPGSRMRRIGRGEIAYGDILEIDELLARIAAVTPQDVQDLAAELFAGPLCLAAIGPFAEGDLDGVLA